MRAHPATEPGVVAARAVRAWTLALIGAWAGGCDGCQAPSRTCASTADCVEGELCVATRCRAVCNSQRDCTGHEACRDGVCLPATDAGAVDATTADRALLDGTCADGCGLDRAVADSGTMAEAGVDAAASDGTATDRPASVDVEPMDLVSHDLVVTDSGPPDAPSADVAAVDQGGADQPAPDQSAADLGATDSPAPDASAADLGVVDQGAVDAGAADLAVADVAAVEASQPDAGAADAGEPDLGSGDTGTADSGVGCWYNASLNTRWPLTIHNSTGVELADFPVLLRLSCSTALPCALFGPGGANLRIADRDCGLLAHEIERWDTSGESLVWFKLPKVLPGESLPLAYLYGDAPLSLVPAPLPPEQVWSNGYQVVYHLGDSVADSSPLHDDGTDSATAQVNAAVGLGRAFDGSQAIRLEDNQPLLQAVDGATVEAWVALDTAPQSDISNLISIGIGSPLPTVTSRVQLFVLTSSELRATVRRLDGDPDTPQILRASLSRGVLHHVVLRVDYSAATLDSFVDGAAGAEQAMTWAGQGLTSDTASRNAALAAQDDGSGRYLRGVLDEVRVSSTARSNAWIALDHLSQQAPGIVDIGAAEAR